MRILPVLVVSLFVLWGEPGGEPAPESIHRQALQPGQAWLDKASRIQPLRPQAVAAHASISDEPLRHVQPGSRVFSLPGGCRSVAESYDLVVHFHGAPDSVEGAFQRSALEGALVVVNLGVGSGRYEQAFEEPAAFGRFVAGVDETLSRLCPELSEHRVERIALSAWSAGYGAIWRILERSVDGPRVDAVLLSDGLHAGFEEISRRRGIEGLKLEPFVQFAKRAARGEALMAVTHSAITPQAYASTTETADFLIDDLGIPRHFASEPGPRPGMVLMSRADYGDFHVQGYQGVGKQAHADQLHAIGDTLYPLLRRRWERSRVLARYLPEPSRGSFSGPDFNGR